MRVLSILLISAVSAVMLFGFLGINFIEHGASPVCPFSMIPGNACPPTSDTVALTMHHISGLEYLMQFVMTLGSTLLVLSLLLLAASLTFFVKIIPHISQSQYPPYLGLFLPEKLCFKPNSRFLRWFALRKKQDPHVLFLVRDMT